MRITIPTVGGNIPAGGTLVKDLYDLSSYINQGYYVAAISLDTLYDYILIGYRMNGNVIRVSIYNSYTAQQNNVTVGGVVLLIKP